LISFMIKVGIENYQKYLLTAASPNPREPPSLFTSSCEVL
jgi:hypothetical protein